MYSLSSFATIERISLWAIDTAATPSGADHKGRNREVHRSVTHCDISD